MPTSCLTGCVAASAANRRREKAGDGPRRDHAQWDLQTAKECARDVEAVLSTTPTPSSLMPCTAICQITGHGIAGAGKTAVYHQRLYPYAFCFPNGQLDMYSKESPEEAPAH